MLDEAFKLRSTLSEMEESALYFISSYAAFKENITVAVVQWLRASDIFRHIC